MTSKKIKGVFYALAIMTVLFWSGWTGQADAFSVDVKQVHYFDPSGPRDVNYDFSVGGIAANTIAFPASPPFAMVPPAEQGLTITWGPYANPNDITVSLDTGASKGTLQSSSHGGVILSTAPTLPAASINEWFYIVKLQNFTGMADQTKVYRTQIGMGSEQAAPHPEFTAGWVPGGNLEIQAQIYDDTGNGTTVWQSSKVSIPSLTPATTILELRITSNNPPNFGKVYFDYRLNGGDWTNVGIYDLPQGTFFTSFPALFPYVDLMTVQTDQQEDPFVVFSFHQNNAGGNKYYAGIFVNDPGQATYESITVTCPGYLVSPATLSYSNNQWWPAIPGPIVLSTGVPPQEAVTCTFNAVKKGGGGTDTPSRTITGYVTDLPANLLPAGLAGTPLTFSWTGIAGASGYFVQLTDLNGNRIWDNDNNPIPPGQTSLPYSGPVLTPGATYRYNVSAGVVTNGVWNHSIAEAQFLYGNPQQTTVYTDEAAFTAALSPAILIDFEDRNTSGGKISFAGNEYAALGVSFTTPDAQPLWVYPPAWYWNSKHLSPGEAPYEGGDATLDSLTIHLNPAVAAIGWTFVDFGNTTGESIRAFAQDGSLILESTDLSGSNIGQGNNPFWGIYSPTRPIARVEITEAANDGDDVAYDNFRIMGAPPMVGLLNFDAVNATAANVPAAAYLAQYGIGLSGVTAGTQVSIINDANMYGGAAMNPSSPPNFLMQTGSNDPVSFTLNFPSLLDSVQFTRPMLVAGPSGIIHPLWSAHALDATGTEIDSAGEGQIASYSNVPPAVFILNGPGIKSLRFDSNNQHVAAFSAVLIDDLTPTTPPIAFEGSVVEAVNYPLTPVAGAAVEVFGSVPAIQTSSAPNGAFTLAGIATALPPLCPPFSVRITAANHLPVYSANMAACLGSNIHSLLPYSLHTPGDVTGWPWNQAKGMVLGKVVELANVGNAVPGTVVTATDLSNPAVTYPVHYLNAQGNFISGPGTSVQANGLYFIFNLNAGVQVAVTAAKTGWNFPGGRVLTSHAGAISEASFFGTPATVSVGGQITDATVPVYNPLGGARIEKTSAPSLFTTSAAITGYYTLPGFTAGETFSLKATKEGYVPSYSADITTFTNTMFAFRMFTSDQFNTLNPSGGALLGGRVMISGSNPTQYLGGAVVTAQGATKSYPAFYMDDGFNIRYDSTYPDGRFFVANVDDGDVVTVTASLPGWNFSPRIFRAHTGSVTQAGIAGVPAALPPAEQAVIQTRFEAAMAAFNANNFDPTTGFPSFISADYIDDGTNKTQMATEAQQDRNNNGSLSWTIQSIVGTGNGAVMNITWNGTENDTFYFRKENGLWMMIGNQHLFESIARTGHQMYSSAPELYWVSLQVEDPDQSSGIQITGVTVTGDGISQPGGISLYHNSQNGYWHAWNANQSQTDLTPRFGNVAPETPLHYTFTISYTGGPAGSPRVQTEQTGSFLSVAPLQNSLGPTEGSTVVGPLSFSWGSAGAGYRYGIGLIGPSMGASWEVYDINDTTIAYNGPPLNGGTYSYTLVTSDQAGSQSFVTTPFNYLNYPRNPVTPGPANDNHPAWNPDSQWIVFDSTRSGNHDIWKINRDGTGLVNLTSAEAGTDEKYPSWSPDGNTIAYISHDSDPQIGGFGAYYLKTMASDGTGQTTRALPLNPSYAYWGFEIKYTEWLDNDQIAFVSYGPTGGSFKLYIYKISTGGVTQVIPSPAEENPNGDIYKISWNAAQGRLAYDRWPTGVQTIAGNGSNYQVLNIPKDSQLDTPSMPGWNPGGTKIAFVKNLYGTSNIAIFDTASETALVEGTNSDDEWPAWSPNGQWIAFVSDGLISTMTLTLQPLSFTGKVYTWSGVAPIEGAEVVCVGCPGDPLSTLTGPDGSFTLTGLPRGTGFYLKFHSGTLHDVYTPDVFIPAGSTPGPVNIGTISLPADADLAPFGLLENEGLIAGRIQDQQYGNGATVSGAVVSATSAGHPLPGYTVTYQDPLGNLGGTATYANGYFYVLNVDDNDLVTVKTVKGNRPDVQRTFHTHGGAVSEGAFNTQAPGYDLIFNGTVRNSLGNPVDGVRVEMNRASWKYTQTDGTGTFNLPGLPRDAHFSLKLTKDGFVPAYTGDIVMNASASGIPMVVLTADNLQALGVDPGTGLLICKVIDNTLTPLSGAQVQLASKMGHNYTVQYEGGGSATNGTGNIRVPDIVNGDVVTVTVSLPGYSFPATYLTGYADAVTEKLIWGTSQPPVKGDINGDWSVTLADAVKAIQVAAGLQPAGVRPQYPVSGADINGGGSIGLEEVLFILQHIAGLRN